MISSVRQLIAHRTIVSTLGHSGQSGHGGHGGHGGSGQAAPGHHGNHGHGHHGHSGGGNAIGGSGLQQTWSSVIKETRFSGEMFRNPLVPLMIYGMVFLSIMLIICLADNNLLDFAVQQHNEAQKKRMQEMATQQLKAEEAAVAQSGAAQESVRVAGEQSDAQPQQQSLQQPQQQSLQQPLQLSQQQPQQQGFDQQLSSAQDFLGAPAQSVPSQQPGFGAQPAAQQGYLQQSLNRQNSGGGFQPPTAQDSQQSYGSYGASYGTYPSSYPQASYGQQGYSQMSGYSQNGYHAAGSQRSGAYMQGGFKTGPDGVSQVPMNRMVINR